jgi:hypothetical protein
MDTAAGRIGEERERPQDAAPGTARHSSQFETVNVADLDSGEITHCR